MALNYKLHFRIISSALKEVFKNIRYTTLALIAAIVFFSLVIYLPNFSLLVDVLRSGGSIFLKAKVFITIFREGLINLVSLNIFLNGLISILFGIYLALIVFTFRKKIINLGNKKINIGLGGIISGILGIGCASCGSFVLSSLFSFLGIGGGIVTLLPLKGAEFSLLGLILLLIGIGFTAHQIYNRGLCKIDISN